MSICSLTKHLEIVAGDRTDYRRLAHFHYRNGRLGPYVSIFAIRPTQHFVSSFGVETVGVIVYTMPSVGLELRNVATGGCFVGHGRSKRLALINRNIRCISRVVIEPRFRGLGLAARLVRETMAKLNVPIIEAMAVMGWINPFFEKAGMKAYKGAMPARCVVLIEALSYVGIEDDDLLDARVVEKGLGRLRAAESRFIERQIVRFLRSYGKRHKMQPGLERTRFVLSKLTKRPVYYIWLNEGLEFSR
jgi:GNAT superfamily N-acetyltransferase